MYIKMYFSAFDKLRHTANYPEVMWFLLLNGWIKFYGEVVQMELEFTNCNYSFIR